MAVNKVVFGTDTLMDISDSTVAPDTLLKDIIAYAANGERIVGTAEAGGLPDGISALATGTFTLTSNKSSHTITHGLGVTPNFFMAVAKTDVVVTSVKSKTTQIFMSAQRVTESGYGTLTYREIYVYSNGSSYSTNDMMKSTLASMFTTNTAVLQCGGSYPFLTGVKWYWVCGVIDGLG